jgi:hypothetical protein
MALPLLKSKKKKKNLEVNYIFDAILRFFFSRHKCLISYAVKSEIQSWLIQSLILLHN